MPFAFIPTALGVCFVLIWVFIGGMILRDGQLAAHRDLEEGSVRPLLSGRMNRATGRGPTKPMRTRVGARAAT